MVFSSNIFLFVFLPFVLLGHVALPARFRNLFLLLASLGFYLWGSGSVVILLLFSIIVNFTAARLIQLRGRNARTTYYLTIIFNLGLLFYFKYFGFFYTELAKAAAGISWHFGPLEAVALPVGISFFTFQAISYLGEVYRQEQPAAENLIDYAMYIALFPHLIAGPIVRFSDIRAEIKDRTLTVDGMFQGIWRFSLGLGKKVIIANNVGATADQIFGLAPTQLSTHLAWLGIVCYTLQIYYDFSGYSDMAIGLARMLGFIFPENFNQPYRAQSVTEFWRRWHITLSRWFRDFVYIPLGGNKHGPLRTYLNLFIVFVLCGFWHGASWTFLCWGLYHGSLLTLERLAKNNSGFEPSGALGNIATMLAVMVGWVIFRSDTLSQALLYCQTLFGLGQPIITQSLFNFSYYFQRDLIVFGTLGVIFAYLPVERLTAWKGITGSLNATPATYTARYSVTLCQSVAVCVLFVYSAAILSTSAFNPFIYFRF